MLLCSPNPRPDVGLAKGPPCAPGPFASSMITSSAFSRHTRWLQPWHLHSQSPAFSLREQEYPFRVAALVFLSPGRPRFILAPGPWLPGQCVPLPGGLSAQAWVCLSARRGTET